MTILSLSEGKKSYILVNEVRRDVFIEDIEILNRFSGGTQEEIIIPPICVLFVQRISLAPCTRSITLWRGFDEVNTAHICTFDHHRLLCKGFMKQVSTCYLSISKRENYIKLRKTAVDFGSKIIVLLFNQNIAV